MLRSKTPNSYICPLCVTCAVCGDGGNVRGCQCVTCAVCGDGGNGRGCQCVCGDSDVCCVSVNKCVPV